MPEQKGRWRSSEFALAVACCRWPPTAQRDEQVREAARSVNWDHFLRVVRRHRVEGLVHDSLRRAGVTPPPRVAEALAATARAIVQDNLRFAAESKRLTGMLDGAGIPHLFVKGLTLGQLAYGSIGLKQACDIDILVDPENYDGACNVLVDAGLAVATPLDGSSREQILRYAAAMKDSIWRNPRSGVRVELHQRLAANALLLRGLRADGDRQLVEAAPRILLPTLQRGPLFAYLCVHGATTAWSRLKWAADLAAFLKDEDAAGIERLYRQALVVAPGRSAAQALLLCAALFGMPLGEELERELRADRGNRALLATALELMGANGSDKELSARPLATLRLHLSLLSLQRGSTYRWAQLARTARLAAGRARALLQLRRGPAGLRLR